MISSLFSDRFGLQLAADFYIFDLQTQVGDTDEFGNVSELVTVSLCIRCVQNILWSL